MSSGRPRGAPRRAVRRVRVAHRDDVRMRGVNGRMQHEPGAIDRMIAGFDDVAVVMGQHERFESLTCEKWTHMVFVQ